MPAVSSSPILSVVDSGDPLSGELAEVLPVPKGPLRLVTRVLDPCERRAPPAVVVAVTTGAMSLATIAQ